MSLNFGLKISKSQSPDKCPYTVYYPHTRPVSDRKWEDIDYIQVISIDPAQNNYAFRIERRYKDGRVIGIVYDKTEVKDDELVDGINYCKTYEVLTNFLDKYEQFYNNIHYVIIERQLPQNYKAVRIEQHTISYFSLKLRNLDTLASIIEVDPKLKGKILGFHKNGTERDLKLWSVDEAIKISSYRNDLFSLQILNAHKKKDDLADTICQAEALFILWGLSNYNPNIEIEAKSEVLNKPQLKDYLTNGPVRLKLNITN